jgi:glycosyltransferase involved in cell wall biosynthesis
MRVLMAHNRYQLPGAEDHVYEAEADLLRGRGHSVVRFELHNDSLTSTNPLAAARDGFWNYEAAEKVSAIVAEQKIEVAHFHNIFPVMSPSVYYAARSAGAAVVQTLHNFRLLCPRCTLFRAGRICHDCAGKPVAWPAVVHGCYRSRSASAVTAAMTAFHGAIGTWRSAVDAYVALTDFSRDLFVRYGLPQTSVFVKPNFLTTDLGVGTAERRNALFVGRLVVEKGIPTLLEAWKRIGSRLPLKIYGDGPLRDDVALAAERSGGAITWFGWKDRAEVNAALGSASVLIFPSVWYECGPLSVIESLARGTPVIAANLGALSEMICPGSNGYHFTPGSADSLVEAVDTFLSLADGGRQLQTSARSAFLQKYTADQGYDNLLELYRFAMAANRASNSNGSGRTPAPNAANSGGAISEP